jgi:hypothetical protein
VLVVLVAHLETEEILVAIQFFQQSHHPVVVLVRLITLHLWLVVQAAVRLICHPQEHLETQAIFYQ